MSTTALSTTSKSFLAPQLYPSTRTVKFLYCVTLATLAGVTGSANAASKNQVVVGTARFSVLTPNCIRIEYAPDGHFTDAPSLFAFNRQTHFDGFKLQKNAKTTVIDTGAIRLTYSPNGAPLSPANLSALIQGGVTWTPNAKNRGNLGGTRKALDTITGPVDIGQGLLSRDGWALIDDSTQPLIVNNWYQARPQNTNQDWYLFGYGSNYRAALKSLAAVSGQVPLPRRNVFGAWYSRYWPYTSDDYRTIVKEYTDHDFPLDNVVFDMDWHRDGWTGWSWNRKLFPDAEKLMADLHAQGLQTTVNFHPNDGVSATEDHYADFMRAQGLPANGKVLRFDATDQKQMKAFSSEILAPLRRSGVDFWWLDWSPAELPWLNEIFTRDTEQDGRRGLSFSRWGGWGDQRHPIHFSGDAEAVWAMLAFEVPFSSTAGNVGCFFWSHDMGGFRGLRNDELYTRWCQFGAVSAALRSHSNRDAALDRRPWTYPTWAENSMRTSFHLRSELFPYIYSNVAQSCRDSVPLLRPLYLDEPQDEASYHNGQEYLYGDNMFAAPIATPGVGEGRVSNQSVHFPKGTWFNTFTGERYAGGADALCAATIDEFPLFARGGAPIPMQPYTARMTTTPLSTLRVRVYPGADGQTGKGQLYEDDGDTKNYQNGAFALTGLSYTRKGNSIEVSVGATKGSFKGQLPSRALRIELPATRRATSASLDGVALPITYDEATATNTIAVPSRSILKATIVKINVADADFDALRNRAQAKRMTALTGTEFAPQNPHDLLQSALKTGLDSAEVTEALAIVGVGVIRKNMSPTFTGGELRDVVYAPEGVLEEEPQVATISQSRVTLNVDGKTIHLPNLLVGTDNVASTAHVTVSGTEKGYSPTGATDGQVDGYPHDKTAEWPSGQRENTTIRLTWDTPQTIDRISLFDRVNLNDQITSGLLTFSDGSTIPTGELQNDGLASLDLHFIPKKVTWVEFKVLSVSPSTYGSGLAEIAIYKAQTPKGS